MQHTPTTLNTGARRASSLAPRHYGQNVKVFPQLAACATTGTTSKKGESFEPQQRAARLMNDDKLFDIILSQAPAGPILIVFFPS